MIPRQQLAQLIAAAVEAGASDAGVVRSDDIVVEDRLADLCGGNPGCPHYGLAASCPPRVAGPTAFRKWQRQSDHAIVVRIDIPTDIMFSDQRRDVMRLLHEIVAGVETAAGRMGYAASRSFAGGSCKELFCASHADCGVLSAPGECRNPQLARPSMSGFGINVTRLLESAGWIATRAGRESAAQGGSMTWVAGLVLIAS